MYRRIFREGLKHFKVELVKKVTYVHADQLKEEERKTIKEMNPSLNSGYMFECYCGRSLK